MVNDKTNPEKKTVVNTVIDISQKLTVDDINKIEKYRQTRKTSVLTVLFTDIVEYTGFTYQAGEIVSGKFRHIHDELIISQIKKDGHGEIIKQIGDSFLIIFSDPTLAVKQALKLQQLFRLNAENLTFKEYQLKIRIGLHMGQVSVEDHIVPDVFGTHVNLASRVMSLARGGQVLVSGSVWDNASGWLKDEQEVKVKSVYYGKIKLKGIGKATEIYEFFSAETAKVGIPKTLLKNKRNKRIIFATIFLCLILFITVPVFFLLKQKEKTISIANLNNKEKIFLADIDSYAADIEFSVNWSKGRTRNHVPEDIQLESVNHNEIEKANENYLDLIKTNLIVDFDIVIEENIKSDYAKIGQILPENLHYDSSLTSNYFLGLMPHLYKFKKENKYWLMIEFTGYRLGIETKTLSTLDSVPYQINEITQNNITEIKKGLYARGKIIKVNNNEALIDFDKEIVIDDKGDGIKYKIPGPGVVLTSFREYSRPKGWDSGTNFRRLNELDKAYKYYGTVKEWINTVDTVDYYFSYIEYRDLKSGYWRAPGCDFYLPVGIDIKIIEIYDTTALAKIAYKEYPWIELEEGDEVQLK
jgi:class 3 adenylate cyclase